MEEKKVKRGKVGQKEWVDVLVVAFHRKSRQTGRVDTQIIEY